MSTEAVAPDPLELVVLGSNEPLLLLDALDLSALLLWAGVVEPCEVPTPKKEHREPRLLLLLSDSDSDCDAASPRFEHSPAARWPSQQSPPASGGARASSSADASNDGVPESLGVAPRDEMPESLGVCLLEPPAEHAAPPEHGRNGPRTRAAASRENRLGQGRRAEVPQPVCELDAAQRRFLLVSTTRTLSCLPIRSTSPRFSATPS